ncbi:MAG: FAD-dependent oxidoreductase [Clostridia bacterium]
MNTQYVNGNPLFSKAKQKYGQYPYLNEDISTDVIIVGGGVTGAILSHYFTKNNVRCVLLEKDRIGYCSTSITTSLLQYELDNCVEDLTKFTTKENAITSYGLGKTALKEIDDFISQNGNNCDYEKKDTLLYTTKNMEKDMIQNEYQIRKENGFDVEYIEEANNPFCFDLKAGLLSINGGAQLDPFKFTHQLIEFSINKGLTVFENTEIVSFENFADKIIAVTAYGNKIIGKKLIIATGFDTEQFTDKKFGTKTITYNIVSKPITDLSGWYNNCLIRDTNEPYNYLRTTKDNKIIIGGEDTNNLDDIYKTSVIERKYDALEKHMKKMFGENIEIDNKYCGVFASTDDNLGFIGEDKDNKNLWYCLGYGANGMLFAILGGMMLSKLYNGQRDENLILFDINRF